MATAEQRGAARQASLIFHAALVAYGIQTVGSSYELWDDVQPVPSTVQSSGSRWFERILVLIGARRRQAQSLAYAYYRYHRALLTGSTLPDYPFAPAVEGEPEEPGPTRPLRQLREDFYGQVEGLVPDLLTEDRELVSEEGEVVSDPPPDDDTPVDVDPLADLEELLQEIDDRAEIEAEAELLNTGLLNLQALIREVDDSLPAAQVDKIREDKHAQAGARQSAAAERVVLAGPRDTVAELTNIDEKVVGYVRVSATGTPCGFCAMLISRGVVYKTKASAKFVSNRGRGKRVEGQQFHENCKCYVEPVYSTEQYDEDDRFDLNREMATAWPRITGGYSGKQALSVWRKWIRNRNNA